VAIVIQEKLLDEKLAQLEKARPWSPRLVSKLESLVRAEDERQLFRVNPLTFGKEKGISEAESVDLFLHATKLGLFQMNWHLLCPGCGMIVESFGSLRSLGPHFHCQICRVDLEATLDDFVEVAFTISPEVRPIRFHDPSKLSVEEFYLQNELSHNILPVGGRSFVDEIREMSPVFAYVEPGETKEFPIQATDGFFSGTDRLLRQEFSFDVVPEAPPTPRLTIKIEGGHYDPPHAKVPPGRFTLVFENRSDRRAAPVVLEVGATHEGAMQEFAPFLTGKQVISTQTFRDLFRTETIEGAEGLSVKDMTVLFTDLKGSTALYDRIGDLKAYAMVRLHFDRLSRVVRANNGAIVKTIGDAVMASFLHPVDATRTALEMLEEIEAFNREHGSREMILKIGIHRGPSIVVTLNDRLDYFGQAINVAARVQGLADADEIFLTAAVRNAPGVAEVLQGHDVVEDLAKLKGVEKAVKVYRVRPVVKKTAVPA